MNPAYIIIIGAVVLFIAILWINKILDRKDREIMELGEILTTNTITMNRSKEYIVKLKKNQCKKCRESFEKNFDKL